MSKLKTFLILVAIIGGLAIFGYLKAIPSEGSARIEINPSFFDFGEVEYGQVLKHKFLVKNTGDEILEIKRVATSCACTTGSIAKDKLNPGEEASLLVEYDTGAMSGPHGKGNQGRIIYVKSNDSINPQVEITIQAYVK